MNPVIHSKISVRKRGGKVEDYLSIHSFMDSTKELCSDNRHRILHNIWGIRRVIIPIFGNTLINSDGKEVNIKDMCEQDHILPDYQNRFIPTLSDFVEAINEKELKKNFKFRFNKIIENYKHDKELKNLLLSPLSCTGLKISLIITHNSWFINEIVPKILKREPEIRNFNIKPSDIFANMDFKLWMDNGNSIPKSALKTAGKIIE